MDRSRRYFCCLRCDTRKRRCFLIKINGYRHSEKFDFEKRAFARFYCFDGN